MLKFTFFFVGIIFIFSLVFSQWRNESFEYENFQTYKATREKTIVTWKLEKGKKAFVSLKCDNIEISISDTLNYYYLELKSLHK